MTPLRKTPRRLLGTAIGRWSTLCVDARPMTTHGLHGTRERLEIDAREAEHVPAILQLAAGGDLPANTPFERVLRLAADPLRAVRSIRGRPLLMINGRFDQTVKPAQATALFEAAGDPKELWWYDGGHWPPQRLIDRAAE